MLLRNVLSCSAAVLGLAGYIAAAHPASAELGPPDSDALVAGYQIIQFDLQECSAIQNRASVTNGGGVSPDILKLSGKICGDAVQYRPLLQKVAKEKGFNLPNYLPYYLTARYAALVRTPVPELGIAYLNDQISSHEDALAIFQDAAANGKDPEIKAMAAQVIPTVQSNLDALKATLKTHS